MSDSSKTATVDPEPSKDDLLAAAARLEERYKNIESRTLVKYLLFAVTCIFGLFSVWYLFARSAAQERVQLACIEMKKVQPTAKCSDLEEYKPIPPTKSDKTGATTAPIEVTIPGKVHQAVARLERRGFGEITISGTPAFSTCIPSTFEIVGGNAPPGANCPRGLQVLFVQHQEVVSIRFGGES